MRYCKRFLLYTHDGFSRIVWGKSKQDVYDRYPGTARSAFEMGIKHEFIEKH